MKVEEICQAIYDFWRPKQYRLKYYPVRDECKHPFALVIPGGGYQMVCSYVEGAPIARELNKRGYAAFVLYYRCGKNAKYPAPMEDVERALQEILTGAETYGIVTDGYSLWGASAGGHLAATMGLTDKGLVGRGFPAPSALILSYPVITMGDGTHIGSRKALLGNTPSEQEIDLASVQNHICEDASPTFLWYGTADKIVDPQNSEMLAAALKKNNIPYSLQTYPNVGHGVGLGKGLACDGWFDKAVDFWEQYRTRK